MTDREPDNLSLFPASDHGDAEPVASDRQALAAFRTEASADLAAISPAPDRAAIDFVQYARDALPRSSFQLRPGERVIDVTTFIRRLREDLAAGPDGPCAESALRDCRTLQALYGRAEKPLRRRERRRV
jgi:hypothetical protein